MADSPDNGRAPVDTAQVDSPADSAQVPAAQVPAAQVAADRTDIDSHSAVAQDYLKAIWSATEWGGRPATTSMLAARFEVSQAGVSDMLRRLAEQGLVTREPYRPVRLTARGERLAVIMVRRHRLIETFLVSTLGYDCTQVHEDAERLEHAASSDFVARLDALLGHPGFDPHGDPIPSPSGEIRPLPGTVPLTEFLVATIDPTASPARRGEGARARCTVVRVSDADPEILQRTHALGIHVGAVLDVDLAATRPGRRASSATPGTAGPSEISQGSGVDANAPFRLRLRGERTHLLVQADEAETLLVVPGVVRMSVHRCGRPQPRPIRPTQG